MAASAMLTGVSTVFAATVGGGNALDPCGENIPGIPPCSTTGPAGIKETIVKILTFVLDLMGLIAVIFIIIAGIRLIVSQGEEEQREKAKKTILYVVIGLIVILFARVIVGFVTGTVPGFLGVG
ncbi:MAG: conserved rane protein of unknown function [Candidatus Peribacteria bacterium]|nr:conserved rane protein of unknown function [Candidatus Peribacteria bacterium]